MMMDKVEDNQPDKSQSSDVSLLMAGLGPSSEDYYPTVVINALLKILKDPSLSQQYQPATQAILNIFQALQLKMVPFLPQVGIVKSRIRVRVYKTLSARMRGTCTYSKHP
jgi:FKBP12-rapamycin complex-associated protein